MADLERTNAGWQLIIDGCEKHTLPCSTTPVDDHGQGLLGYYRPPSDPEIMQHKLAAPLRGKRAQRPLPVSGLFSHHVVCS
ncbi:MAG: hypothetical protein OEQ29_18865 [Alphaproteobacteria bacterium]|nr:hypothetical protein [Alphaproteobacteria bacterium]